MSDYADPQAIVSTEWVGLNGHDPNIALVEVDGDPTSYGVGHIPGAIFWDWQTDLADKLRRDIVGPSELEALLSKSGITNTTAIVLYGDDNNAYAAWAFWQLKIHGHRDVRLMDGGREKWLAEGRPLSTETPEPAPTTYRCRALYPEYRAFLPQVKIAFKSPSYALVDVRSSEEFTGHVAAKDARLVSQRYGHIPGARNIPWERFCEKDGTFKSAEELRKLFAEKGVSQDKEVITYCCAGERGSQAWFVLKYLLGYPIVKNYDGSWAEWGNLVGVAIEQGDERPPRNARLGNERDR